MHSLPRSSPARFRHGGSLVPVLIVVAALLLSTAIFFLFTKKKMMAGQEAENASVAAAKAQNDAAQAKSAADAAKSTAAPKAATVGTAKPQPPAVPPAPTPAFGFARPMDLGKQLVRSLASGDFATAGKLAATTDAAQAGSAAMLFQKLSEMGFKPGTEDQVELLGLVENRTRIAIPFTKPGTSETLRIQLDLERDERMGWKIAKATLPKEMSAAIVAMPQAPAAAGTTPPSPGTLAPMKQIFAVEDGTDALAFASDFVSHLLRHDFAAAKKYVDEAKVPVERLVGLCIVFEEGGYALNPSKPLIITIANPEVSWVIAQVQSETLQQNTEFGVELKRADIAQPWKVAGLNLSDILGAFAKNASKLGVPYTPIVKNPKGGESLALYFEYDRAELHPRAQKQIEVISALMKADPSKKLRIAGHTDEKGEDSYNINLSRTRAEAVKQQLIALGVPAAQVETTALGKAQPLSPNKKADGSDNPEGRSHNRRAEIYLDF
ncbi:MAG: OmpA family protein [Prosthecobacter sp.]|jgi:outer membrane protein OmpA-like peptidoglycan-associated protein|uniref:OmpA family protein n=1 Tax=Prosthecobacter sp. TaxID=1965333 RepID=UPI0019FF3D2C|nr:OmpA family protein [Prosthecobacter sp.]MBE2287705.1 OmpA family protein [Prosthecobacter sp.]